MSLRASLLAVTAVNVVMGVVMGAVVSPALADGDSSKTAMTPPPPRAFSTNSVSVDYSALDSVPNRSLLLPTTGGAARGDGGVVLRPPPGVKATAPAVIRLRPPPGVQRAAAPVQKTEAPKTEAAKPETKMAVATPAPLPPEPKAAAPKSAAPTVAPPPAAKAPAPATTTAAAPPPAAAQKPAAPAPAAAPPPAPKQTQVATATPAAPAPAAVQQPRSLLTPPPVTSAPAAAPPAAAPPAAGPKIELPKVEAPKAPEAKTAEAPAETKVAVLPPPAKTPDQPDTVTIAFKIGGADLPGDATAGVKALAARLAKDPAARIQLVAYASDPEKSISRSRRLSLERAVNVRKVLLASGVESTRIDIRALGEQSGTGAPDRVDAITVKR